MVNWKKHDKVKYKNTTNVSYNNKSGGSNLCTRDHAMGEIQCNVCSEINHDIKRERKTEITWIKE